MEEKQLRELLCSISPNLTPNETLIATVDNFPPSDTEIIQKMIKESEFIQLENAKPIGCGCKHGVILSNDADTRKLKNLASKVNKILSLESSLYLFLFVENSTNTILNINLSKYGFEFTRQIEPKFVSSLAKIREYKLNKKNISSNERKLTPEGYRLRSGGICYKVTEGELKLLLLKRRSENSYTFAGGGVEEDESAEQAVLREVFEELGVIGEVKESLGVLKELEPKKLTEFKIVRVDKEVVDYPENDRLKDWFVLDVHNETSIAKICGLISPKEYQQMFDKSLPFFKKILKDG
eukprot:snap_masked-scaffold_8-processed-gene-13.45-mRNA-1 protein AED:1.00 eAED:1.00 QI:0/-1/0/0/-1/1/1/0/294